jgi:hypothetical protein
VRIYPYYLEDGFRVLHFPQVRAHAEAATLEGHFYLAPTHRPALEAVLREYGAEGAVAAAGVGRYMAARPSAAVRFCHCCRSSGYRLRA